MQTIQMHLSQKQKHFSQFFLNFQIYMKFSKFSKKITVIAYVFPTLRTPKDVVRKMPKKSCFRGPIDKQRGTRANTLFQSQR